MKLIAPSRIQRRLGEKLFLKAERDATPKSAMVRRPYPPGAHGKTRRRTVSEFGAELREKQKIRHLYGLSDAVLKRYVRQAAKSRGKIKTQALAGILELRFDNVVWRLGLAASARIARQLVSHGHMLLNGRPSRIPSRLLRIGDKIAIKEKSRAAPVFEGLAVRLRKHQPPEWLTLDAEAAGGEVKRMPTEEESQVKDGLSKVIEYYSR